MTFSLVDTHCHLDLLEDNIPAVIKRAQENGVQYFINVCVSLREFNKVLATAEQYPFVFASVGLHPNDQEEETSEAQLIELARSPKVIAIGETGLDYYRVQGDLNWQRDRFRAHIRAAKATKKPLIIHTRASIADTLQIMREENAQEVQGIMHCFTENWEAAQQALAMNFYISISGIVTFKNAADIQEVATRVPLDRLLIETDAPYLAPVPNRGKPNEPGYVRYTAEYIAKLRNISFENLATATTQNFYHLFKGVLPPHV